MMTFLRNGLVTAAIIGVLWTFVIATTVAIGMSFGTGDAFRPSLLGSLIWGAALGLACLPGPVWKPAGAAAIVAIACILGYGPLAIGPSVSAFSAGIGALAAAGFSALGLWVILDEISPGPNNRHLFEAAVIRFLTGFGYIFFSAIVLIPFYVMVLTSLKNQSELIQNPLDFTIDLGKGMDLFRSYSELFGQFNFGTYLLNSFIISVLTVLITLLFAVPGAYAVARLRFKGRAVFSRSVLLIYMVPMIVLALPIYIAYSMTGLRNTLGGIVMIYPVTTIPVALYMLQGYFRGLPVEVEEAGLMDGLSRLKAVSYTHLTLPTKRIV